MCKAWPKTLGVQWQKVKQNEGTYYSLPMGLMGG